MVEGRSGAAAAACEWMRPALKGDKGVDNLHRLYYAAHRGLHARKCAAALFFLCCSGVSLVM